MHDIHIKDFICRGYIIWEHDSFIYLFFRVLLGIQWGSNSLYASIMIFNTNTLLTASSRPSVSKFVVFSFQSMRITVCDIHFSEITFAVRLEILYEFLKLKILLPFRSWEKSVAELDAEVNNTFGSHGEVRLIYVLALFSLITSLVNSPTITLRKIWGGKYSEWLLLK